MTPVPEDAGVPEMPRAELPLLPAEQVFLPDPPPPVPRRRFPGPGFFESLLWIVGFLGTLIVAQIVTWAVLFVVQIAGHDRAIDLLRDSDEMVRLMSQVFTQHMGAIFGVSEAATVLYAAIAIMWRLGPNGLKRLGLQIPSPGHSILVLLLILPLSFLCSQIQIWITDWFPGSDFGLEESLLALRDLPFLVLVVCLAVCPALGEELIFRGLIGRGLVTRWGVFTGVLVTSVLFGLTHLRPAHALAVIPLGIAMHFVYLTTGSIWGPVLLHFLNNAWAAFVLKYREQAAGALAADDAALPLELLAASAAAVCAVLMLLWQTRIGHSYSTDRAWYPGEPGGTDATLVAEPFFAAQRPRPLLIACGTFCVIGFFAVFIRVTFAAN